MLEKLKRLHIESANEKILSAVKLNSNRIAESVAELDFIVNSIAVTNNDAEIVIQLIDVEPFYRLLCGESIRFFLAANASLGRSQQVHKQNASWQIVENYYAAYYSIHYLIRTLGISLTNFEDRAITAISKNYTGPAYAGKVPSGLYTLRFNASNNCVILKKRIKKNGGGSHLEAWGLWEDLLNKMIANSAKDITEYAAASLLLTEHMNFIVKSTGRYTPPEIRGDINYKFEGKTWFFEDNASKTITSLQTFLNSPAINVSSSNSNIKNFVICNNLVIALADTVFKHSVSSYDRSICRSIHNKFLKNKGI